MRTKMLKVDEHNILVTWKKTNKYALHLTSKGNFTASFPLGISEDVALAWLKEKKSWLDRVLLKYKSKEQFEIYEGEELRKVLYLGKWIDVIFIDAVLGTAKMMENTLFLPNNTSSLEEANNYLNAFYYARFKEILENRLPIWEERTGKHFKHVTIRNNSTRFGSCNPKRQSLNINISLIHFPLECIDEVICHELCHFYEMNHSKQFYSYLDKFYPTWREADKYLKRKN